MARLSTVFVALSAIFFAASASPVPSGNELQARSRTGRGTWFDVGLGACGDYNVNSDHILALSSEIYGGGKFCGQTVHITNTANGQSASGVVKDECPGCGANDIDLSPSLFQELGDLDTGVLRLTWEFD